ncbi:Trp biosynthesis-associated membrane protein [Cellulomonas sp. HZM]|uniref:Trp biosynthesis-associated membrane protein n=1 Tax=Cellulomonas sp. HZM TaxID=1454010 RepID=UPI000A3E27FA|nr:Trp biosynthesis-associated membrane protein [Cellulomonas sp. HZM]
MLVLAAAVGLVCLPVWTSVAAPTVLDPSLRVDVHGGAAVPGAPASALVLLACAAALALVGRAGRWVVGAVVVVAGVVIAWASLDVVRHPAGGAMERALVDATGVPHVAGAVDVQPWPYVAVALGVLVAAAGVWVVVVSRRWPGPTRRHEGTTGDAPGAGAVTDERSAWDALSRGDDPT